MCPPRGDWRGEPVLRARHDDGKSPVRGSTPKAEHFWVHDCGILRKGSEADVRCTLQPHLRHRGLCVRVQETREVTQGNDQDTHTYTYTYTYTHTHTPARTPHTKKKKRKNIPQRWYLDQNRLHDDATTRSRRCRIWPAQVPSY